jgi:hypothetical protein
MTYDDIINDGNIAFVVLKPSPNKDNQYGMTILRKEAFTDLYREGYVFEGRGGQNGDIAYMVRRGD